MKRLERMARHLREQNWTAIAIELVIVVIGVFLGMQVTAWNAARIERNEADKLLERLGGFVQADLRLFDSTVAYYRTVTDYGEVALRGWDGDPTVGDEQFVIAVYQATQVIGMNRGAQFSNLFAGDAIATLPNGDLRDTITGVLSNNLGNLALSALTTPYRQGVRRTLPLAVQDAIRKECGDRYLRPDYELPARCDVDLPEAVIADAAAGLRAEAHLEGELRWHLSEVQRVIGIVGEQQWQERQLLPMLPTG